MNMQLIKNLAKKIDLLVVEDEKSLRQQIVNDVFRPLGFKNIQNEADGRAGLISFQQNKQQLIVTDFDMPNMDGVQMINKIFATEARPQVVIMTQHGSDKTVKQSFFGDSKHVLLCDKKLLYPVLSRQNNEDFWNIMATAMMSA